MKVGKTIKRIRKTRNISQKEMADLVGVTQSYLSVIESNKKNCSMEVLESILKALNVNLYLFFISAAQDDEELAQNPLFKKTMEIIEKALELITE